MEIEVANNAKKAHRVVIDEVGKRKYYYGPQKYRKQWQTIPELRGIFFYADFLFVLFMHATYICLIYNFKPGLNHQHDRILKHIVHIVIVI